MEGKTIIQQNLQGSYVATSQFGQAMRSQGAPFALVQEPYFWDGGVKGLSGDMRVFPDLVGDSAVVVGDGSVGCMLVSRTRWGVSVKVMGSFGRVLLVSIYCRFGEPLEPNLDYVDTVLLVGSNIPTILGLDANACSSM